MAKFNPKTKHSTKTVNMEGGEAFLPTNKLELMLRTMSFLMSGDGYYQKEKDASARIAELVKSISKSDPKFVLNLAAYARKKMYLRSVPVYLLVEYAKAGTKLQGAFKYVPAILRRADEPAEALAYYFKSAQTRKLPAMLKKGIGLSLNQFDEYQLAKYDREGEVSLKDVVFLTHPVPKDAGQQELYDKIVKGELATPDTWEVKISAKGSTKEAWEEIIPSMGYMALLRNLRNFVKAGVDPNIYVPIIESEKAIRNAKQFPYRFFSAHTELQHAGAPSRILDAVNTAMELSALSVPKIPGKTAIFSDNSGSMYSQVSDKSKVRNIDIAALFSAISLHVCNESLVGVFGCRYKTVGLSKKSQILDNMERIRNTDVDMCTNAYLTIQHLREKCIRVDRIFLFSDMQCYNSYGGKESVNNELALYRKEINPACRLYSFDLAQYGLLTIPQGDPLTCPIGGYSDTIFRFVPMFETDRATMLKEIEGYNPFE